MSRKIKSPATKLKVIQNPSSRRKTKTTGVLSWILATVAAVGQKLYLLIKRTVAAIREGDISAGVRSCSLTAAGDIAAFQDQNHEEYMQL